MKVKIGRPSNKLYALILRSFLCVTAVVLILSSTFSYISYENMLIERLYASDLVKLEKEQDQTNAIIQIGTTMVQQIYTDWNVYYLLYNTEDDVYNERVSFTQLNKYRLSIPNVESIYIYNGRTGNYHVSADSYGNFYISPEDFCDQQLDLIRTGWNNIENGNPIARTAQIRTAKGYVSRTLYTFGYRDIFAGNDASFVFLNFSSDWLSQKTGIGNESSDHGFSLIIDSSGYVVSNGSKYPMTTDLSNEPFYQKLLEKGTDSGYFTTQMEGEKVLVTYTNIDQNGWRYIKVTPYQFILKEVQPIRRFVLLIDGAVLVLSLGVVYLLSKRIYIPIGRVNDKLTEMEAEYRSTKRLKSQYVLRRLLIDGYLEETHRLDYIDQENLPVEIGTTYRVLLICINHYREFRSRSSPRDLNLDIYSIMNIAEELCREDFNAVAVDMEEDGYISLILSNKTDSPEPANDMIQTLMDKLHDTVYEILNLNLSFVVSGAGVDLRGIHWLYWQTQQTVFHRIFYPLGSVLFAEDFLPYIQKSYTYPVKKEEMMIDAILSGQEEKAQQLVSAILSETREYAFSVLNLVVARLVLALDNIHSTTKDIPSSSDKEINGGLQLRYVDSIQEVEQYFFERIHLVVECFEQKHNIRYKELIDRVNQIIEQDYTDNNLCLDSIAQTVQMSAAYLGRLYRTNTRKSIADVICETRLRHAKDLLIEEPKTSITAIAERTGFTSISYFSRVFRRENGITPNEYRNRHIQGKQD